MTKKWMAVYRFEYHEVLGDTKEQAKERLIEQITQGFEDYFILEYSGELD